MGASGHDDRFAFSTGARTFLTLVLLLHVAGHPLPAQQNEGVTSRRAVVLLLSRPQDREVERLFRDVVAQPIRWNLERRNLILIESDVRTYGDAGNREPIKLSEESARHAADFVLLAEYGDHGQELELHLSWYAAAGGECLHEVRRRGRKDLFVDRVVRDAVDELLAAAETSLTDLPRRPAAAGRRASPDGSRGAVAAGGAAGETANGEPSSNPHETRGGASGREARPTGKRFELILGCAPFVTTGAASEYFKLGVLPSLTLSYLSGGQTLRLGLGLYTGVNIFSTVGSMTRTENLIIPLGPSLRCELGDTNQSCILFAVSGGPALLSMRSTVGGTLSGLTFYGRGSLGVRLPLNGSLALTLEAGYDVYWEKPTPIMGFSPALGTSLRL